MGGEPLHCARTRNPNLNLLPNGMPFPLKVKHDRRGAVFLVKTFAFCHLRTRPIAKKKKLKKKNLKFALATQLGRTGT